MKHWTSHLCRHAGWEGRPEEISFLALFVAMYILAFCTLYGVVLTNTTPNTCYPCLEKITYIDQKHVNTFKSQGSSIKLSGLLAPIICIFLHIQGLELACYVCPWILYHTYLLSLKSDSTIFSRIICYKNKIKARGGISSITATG